MSASNNYNSNKPDPIKFEDLTDDYQINNKTLYPKTAECDLDKMYENL